MTNLLCRLMGVVIFLVGLDFFAESAKCAETAGSPIPEELPTRDPISGRAISQQPSVFETSEDTQAKSDTGFSLDDLVGAFLELGAPGDPNQTDKLRLRTSTTIGYDDNVFTTNTDPIASGTASLDGEASYNFGDERLKLSSSLAGGVTYYDNRPGDDTDYNGTFRAATSYFVTRRLRVSGDAAIAYLSQPNPTVIGGVSRFNGDYITANLGFDVSYNLTPRFSARVGYRFTGIQYTDESQNESLGFTQETYFVGLDYLVSPRFTLTTEYRYSPLSYYESDQNSTGHIYTVGFVALFSPKFRWTLQGGAEARVLENATQGDAAENYVGPFLETDVSYEFRPGSSLSASLRYGTEPSGVAGISIRETLRGTLAMRYAFTPRLVGDVALSYQHDNFDQPGNTADFTQTFYTASLGLRFQLNPALAATAGYSYSAVQSENSFDEYTRNITTVGLEIIF